jgi:hypothetical protein
MHPTGLLFGSSAANKLLFAVGAEVPAKMNWWAGKLGP